jgi:hypothetical protein
MPKWDIRKKSFGFEKSAFIAGVANPRPRKNFLRPNLGFKVGDFSIFWMIFLCFRQNAAQKVDIFSNFFPMRLRDQFGLATSALLLIGDTQILKLTILTLYSNNFHIF